jgi:hypothetical protein
MDNSAREYRYQADFSLSGEMYHVRCDDWDEFKDAVANIKTEYIKVPAATTPVTPSYNNQYNPPPPSVEGDAPCKTCGAPTLPEKKILAKDGRAWWVRDCSTGDRTHKGPIRPAS